MFKKKSLLAASMALILAACGQGGESSEESSSNPDAKEVTVAVENSSKPLSFTDDSGELTGYEVETIKALDEVVDDYNFNIESADAEGTQVGLDTGKYQMIGGGLYKTKEREDLYLFPDENSGASIIRIYKRKDDDSIKTLDDLTDKKVHPVTPNGGIFNLLTEYNEK
ncbi:MAG: transporter substrate-binding domain-containing protein [Aerococcus suis]|nr:transporter substrate-binding domain-containing protein [Aerococcus suis]